MSDLNKVLAHSDLEKLEGCVNAANNDAIVAATKQLEDDRGNWSCPYPYRPATAGPEDRIAAQEELLAGHRTICVLNCPAVCTQLQTYVLQTDKMNTKGWK